MMKYRSDPTNPAPDERRIKYTLPLEGGRRAVLVLPDDLTEAEADRVALFCNTVIVPA
jgi:hypothetical protein